MWQENVDCQPIVSRYDVLKYIVKYSLKEERRYEIYHDMLTTISFGSACDVPVLCAYRRFLAETLVECDI